MTRFVVLTPDGKVLEYDQPVQQAAVDTLTGAASTHIVINAPSEGVSVTYDSLSHGDYNPHATRLLRERLMPGDVVRGLAIVAGPTDHMGIPTDVPELSLYVLKGRLSGGKD